MRRRPSRMYVHRARGSGRAGILCIWRFGVDALQCAPCSGELVAAARLADPDRLRLREPDGGRGLAPGDCDARETARRRDPEPPARSEPRSPFGGLVLDDCRGLDVRAGLPLVAGHGRQHAGVSAGRPAGDRRGAGRKPRVARRKGDWRHSRHTPSRVLVRSWPCASQLVPLRREVAHRLSQPDNTR